MLTCKHHDGFCLWPSAYTEHSVKNSPWKNGKGDVVREVSDACRRGGIKFGVYLSPWDRNSPYYGTDEYNDYFCNQLRELLTNYGDIFCVWFDGACGEGPNGKRQEYDWQRYYALIRELQPNAVISICGPDVRWCGNEAGDCRESEWSVVPSRLRSAETVAEKSQQDSDTSFARKKLSSGDRDLGSRNVIAGEESLCWYPAEVDTSIRPGWFYHRSQDFRVRSLSKLLSIYYQSVGGNACLLLNVPPDRNGLLTKYDVKRLHQLGDALRKTFADNLAENACATANESVEEHDIMKALSSDEDEYWRPQSETEKAEIIVELPQKEKFSKVVLGEYLPCGQHIESFSVWAEASPDKWKQIYQGTVVGHKRICLCKKATAKRVKIVIEQCRTYPTLRKLEIYK